MGKERGATIMITCMAMYAWKRASNRKVGGRYGTDWKAFHQCGIKESAKKTKRQVESRKSRTQASSTDYITYAEDKRRCKRSNRWPGLG